MRQRAKILLTVVILMITIGAGLSGSVLASDSERFDPVDLAAVDPAELILRESENLSDWSTLIGDLTLGYSMVLDPANTYEYIDIETLEATPALADGYYEFYFDAFRAPDGFWTYWADKGVTETATGWQGDMWSIINGEEPMFYLKALGGGYNLVDGYQYLYESTEAPLRVNGDYPLGTYHFGGWVTDTGDASEYLNIQMTFTKQATVSLEIEETDTWTIDGCGYLDVYIHLANVHDLYAVDISLDFDETVLEVVDMLPDDPGTTEIKENPGINLLPVNDWFDAGYWVANVADNGFGTIQYTAAQLNTTSPANGDGDIAMIRFRAKAIGSSDITVTGAELSDRDGYLVGRPVNYAVPAPTITTDFTAAGGLDLEIIRLDNANVKLSWPKEVIDDGVEYNLYRSTLPYFEISDGQLMTGYVEDSITGEMTFTDPVLGKVGPEDPEFPEPENNYFYAYGLQIVCSNGFTSPLSAQVGKIEYQLWETNKTDFSWVGFPLENLTISTDKTLANHIEENIYAGTVVVDTINSWNPVAQSFTVYNHGDNSTSVFDVIVKQAYQIELDINGTTSGSVIWALVGKLPPITENTYTLYETAKTDFSWILQPLDTSGLIQNSLDFASEIEAFSSGAVDVKTVNWWNGEAQSFTTDQGSNSFNTRFGYPYMIEVDVIDGSSVTWPLWSD